MDIIYDMPNNRNPVTFEEMEAEKKRIKKGDLFTFYRNDCKTESTNTPRKMVGVVKETYPNFFIVEYSVRGNWLNECITWVDAAFYRRGLNPFAP